MPAYQNPDRANATASRVQVSLFLCPSDTPPLGDWPGATNYLANQDSWLCDLSENFPSTVSPTDRIQGIFYFLSAVKIADITDGTSNTVFFSEKIKGTGVRDGDARSDQMLVPAAGLTTAQLALQACRASNPTTALRLTYRMGASWTMGEMCCTTYNHVEKPNGVTCASPGFQGNMANMPMIMPPSSKHPGGVNSLMGDGSVKFVKDTTALETWRALGTRNGGEAISADQF
jgi:prepilin-type processing-associated H-X9-DG protein